VLFGDAIFDFGVLGLDGGWCCGAGGELGDVEGA
jgi:hypothetical protein